MNIIFWGAGRFWEDHIELIGQTRNCTDDDWICIFDNDESKWGRKYLEIRVCEPKRIDDAMYVVTSVYFDEIKQELINRFQVRTDKIISFFEYARMVYAKRRYTDRYKERNKYAETYPFKDKKMAVYTCITGKCDLLREPVHYNLDLDYICFTNDTNLHSKIWDIRYIRERSMDDIHLARYMKIFPDIFLKEYEVSIWVDGKFQIKGDLKEYIKLYEKNKSILCFPHPERTCIYDEAEMCKKVKRGVPEDIDRQIFRYRKEDYPINNGLYETGCIVRSHFDSTVQKMMRAWWEEIEKYCYRDQISFPYVLWKHKYLPDICDLDINKNEWLEMVRGKV